MAVQRSRRRIARSRIRALTEALLEASTLCAVATVSARGRAHVNTAYFAWSPTLDLVWLSHPGAAHSRNVRARRTVAVAVYDSRQRWGKPDRGIQLFGTGAELEGRAAAAAARVYTTRFPEYGAAELASYRLYRLRPQRLKLFDEEALGAGVFVTARLRGGDVVWERTDVV